MATAINEFSRGKSILVLAIVVGCFAILWPKIFYPMLTASLSSDPNENNEIDKCCDIISDKDYSAYKILNDICSNLLNSNNGGGGETRRRLLESLESEKKNKYRKIPVSTANLCRREIQNTCGIDIYILTKENPTISKEYSESLNHLRTYNVSQCLKFQFGLDFSQIGLPRKFKAPENLPNHMRPERPLHLRNDKVHPALRDKGKAVLQKPQRTIEKEARPGPMPGVRPPVGAGHHQVSPPKTAGTMGIIMPLYTIGIVIFFLYTIMKIIFRKAEEPKESPIHLDTTLNTSRNYGLSDNSIRSSREQYCSNILDKAAAAAAANARASECRRRSSESNKHTKYSNDRQRIESEEKEVEVNRDAESREIVEKSQVNLAEVVDNVTETKSEMVAEVCEISDEQAVEIMPIEKNIENFDLYESKTEPSVEMVPSISLQENLTESDNRTELKFDRDEKKLVGVEDASSPKQNLFTSLITEADEEEKKGDDEGRNKASCVTCVLVEDTKIEPETKTKPEELNVHTKDDKKKSDDSLRKAIGSKDYDARDNEIDCLKMKLLDTQSQLESIMKQMANFSDRLSPSSMALLGDEMAQIYTAQNKESLEKVDDEQPANGTLKKEQLKKSDLETNLPKKKKIEESSQESYSAEKARNQKKETEKVRPKENLIKKEVKFKDTTTSEEEEEEETEEEEVEEELKNLKENKIMKDDEIELCIQKVQQCSDTIHRIAQELSSNILKDATFTSTFLSMAKNSKRKEEEEKKNEYGKIIVEDDDEEEDEEEDSVYNSAHLGDRGIVLGIEETLESTEPFLHEVNSKASSLLRQMSATPPMAPSPLPPQELEDIPSIFLEGSGISAANQFIVSETTAQCENDLNDYVTSPDDFVLSGRVTLSVVSSDVFGANDITEPPDITYSTDADDFAKALPAALKAGQNVPSSASINLSKKDGKKDSSAAQKSQKTKDSEKYDDMADNEDVSFRTAELSSSCVAEDTANEISAIQDDILPNDDDLYDDEEEEDEEYEEEWEDEDEENIPPEP